MDAPRSQNVIGSETQNLWPSFARHRPAQHSLPMNTYARTPTATLSPKIILGQVESSSVQRFDKSVQDNIFGGFVENNRIPPMGHLPMQSETTMPRKLQGSFSTSDLPTMRTINGAGQLGIDQHRRAPSNDYHSVTMILIL